MKKVQRTRQNDKNTCVDCFQCKVSAKSTKKCRLCYCVATKNQKRHKETYWQQKKVCKNFVDMSDRRPLLNFNK